jgi:predicted Zn-dependent protease with MMP-like domain
VKPGEFEALVEQALDELPDLFKEKLENISIVVEDYPSAEVLRGFRRRTTKLDLLGVYIGVPYTHKTPYPLLGNVPDRIELYQKNIESICRDEREIIEQVKETVIHEVGHYFGLDEKTLRRLQRK